MRYSHPNRIWNGRKSVSIFSNYDYTCRRSVRGTRGADLRAHVCIRALTWYSHVRKFRRYLYNDFVQRGKSFRSWPKKNVYIPIRVYVCIVTVVCERDTVNIAWSRGYGQIKSNKDRRGKTCVSNARNDIIIFGIGGGCWSSNDQQRQS